MKGTRGGGVHQTLMHFVYGTEPKTFCSYTWKTQRKWFLQQGAIICSNDHPAWPLQRNMKDYYDCSRERRVSLFISTERCSIHKNTLIQPNPLHYRFLHGQAQQNWLPGLLKQFNRLLWVHSESWVSKSGYWGHLRKLRFCVFLAIFTKPHQFCLRSRVFSPFWHSAIVVNIIGDEYGSILIFTVFGFGLFLAVFGHFWAFLALLGFWWRFGGIGSASEL